MKRLNADELTPLLSEYCAEYERVNGKPVYLFKTMGWYYISDSPDHSVAKNYTPRRYKEFEQFVENLKDRHDFGTEPVRLVDSFHFATIGISVNAEFVDWYYSNDVEDTNTIIWPMSWRLANLDMDECGEPIAVFHVMDRFPSDSDFYMVCKILDEFNWLQKF